VIPIIIENGADYLAYKKIQFSVSSVAFVNGFTVIFPEDSSIRNPEDTM